MRQGARLRTSHAAARLGVAGKLPLAVPLGAPARSPRGTEQTLCLLRWARHCWGSTLLPRPLEVAEQRGALRNSTGVTRLA